VRTHARRIRYGGRVRIVAIALMLVGLSAAVVGALYGFQSLFAWNGRHVVDTRPLDEGATHHVLVPAPGRRYTVSVQAVFDRATAAEREGAYVVEAKMPLVLRVTDQSDTRLVELAGWLDPNEPPNVLYGQSARPSAHAPELSVERLARPFHAASTDPVAVDVDLGPDRIGTTRILTRRLVIYDDALPGTIRQAFVGAGVGVLVFTGAVVALLVSFFRGRKRKPRRKMAASV
jgi:hypothetical protein